MPITATRRFYTQLADLIISSYINEIHTPEDFGYIKATVHALPNHCLTSLSKRVISYQISILTNSQIGYSAKCKEYIAYSLTNIPYTYCLSLDIIAKANSLLWSTTIILHKLRYEYDSKKVMMEKLISHALIYQNTTLNLQCYSQVNKVLDELLILHLKYTNHELEIAYEHAIRDTYLELGLPKKDAPCTNGELEKIIVSIIDGEKNSFSNAFHQKTFESMNRKRNEIVRDDSSNDCTESSEIDYNENFEVHSDSILGYGYNNSNHSIV